MLDFVEYNRLSNFKYATGIIYFKSHYGFLKFFPHIG